VRCGAKNALLSLEREGVAAAPPTAAAAPPRGEDLSGYGPEPRPGDPGVVAIADLVAQVLGKGEPR
jgi:hypothetical protein